MLTCGVFWNFDCKHNVAIHTCPLPGPALVYPAVVIMGIGSWVYVPKLLTLPMQRPA